MMHYLIKSGITKLHSMPVFLLSLLILFSLNGCTQQAEKENLEALTISMPYDGNCWRVSEENSESDTFNIYFHTSIIGEFHFGILVPNLIGNSKIGIEFEGKSKKLKLTEALRDTIYIGKFAVSIPGYQSMQLTGARQDIENLGQISEFLLGGEAVSGNLNFVRNDFYWGKRGPSVHLNYPVPEEAGDVRWFYNEITIPQGNDVLGSYFMANGFAQGYFGIQVNSETERRILFSVWSPFRTDDPREIPDDMKIGMLGKGEGVYTGEFGNEGSGGQSYLKFPWKAGETYGFLLKGEPLGNNSTVFTAWFYAPEEGNWKLIASFSRPDTDTHLMRLHSFLENFYPKTGDIARMGKYSNQWVCNTEGEWYELTNARFTADATARKNARLDYAGGIVDDVFYMKNCGFTNDHTVIDTHFERKAGGKQPNIDFPSLPGND